MNYKQRIQVRDNVTDIMKLPCVQSAHKRSGKEREVAYYILEPSAMADSEHWQYAHPGEWLVQGENGKWNVETEDATQESRLCEDTPGLQESVFFYHNLPPSLQPHKEAHYMLVDYDCSALLRLIYKKASSLQAHEVLPYLSYVEGVFEGSAMQRQRMIERKFRSDI